MTLGVEYVAVIVPGMVRPALVHVAVGLLPVKEVKPDMVITSATVVDVPVNPTVMVVAVEMTLAEKAMEAEVKAAANMAGATFCWVPACAEVANKNIPAA